MKSQRFRGVTRRTLLGMGSVAAFVAALPSQVWALAMRPAPAFGATDVDTVFSVLGSTPKHSDGIVFSVPDIAENGAVVPVKIEIDDTVLPGVSKLYVLVEKNPNPLAAVFGVPENTRPYVETRVKVAQTCQLYAVAEADGQLFMVSRETKVTLGGCGG